MNFTEAVRAAFRTHSSRPAIEAEGGVWTYSEALGRASRLAEVLDKNLAAGEPVGIQLRRSGSAYLCILATFLSGRPFVPLSSHGGLERAGKLAASIGLAAAWRENESGELALDSLGNKPAPAPAESLAYVMFTSGSSGRPKAVGITGRQLESYLKSAGALLRIGKEDRVSQFFELSFDLSVHDLFLTWLSGACLVHVPDQARLFPPSFIRDAGLSVWFSTPSALRNLGDAAAASLPGLRESLFCGEPLFVSQALRWRELAPESRIWNFYGPTESTIAVTAHCWPTNELAPKARAGVVSIGLPFPGHELALAENGELSVSGPQVCRGYYPAVSHPAFRSDPEGRAWYATGDLAATDGQRYFFLGRADRQVKLLGQRVELTEVEEALSSLLGGAPVAAIAVAPTEGTPSALYAFVESELKDEIALFRRLREILPEAMVPLEIFQCVLPLTSHGKTDHERLKAILRERLSPEAAGEGGASS